MYQSRNTLIRAGQMRNARRTNLTTSTAENEYDHVDSRSRRGQIRSTGAHVTGARVEATSVPAVARSSICMRGATKSSCHVLTLSHLEPSRGKAASMPAAARPYCLFARQRFGMLAFGLCWSANGLADGRTRLPEPRVVAHQ